MFLTNSYSLELELQMKLNKIPVIHKKALQSMVE